MDYTKECWYCHQQTMQSADDLGHEWYRCSKCGATWIKEITPTGFTLVARRDPGKGGTSYSVLGV
jgi:hypothetical protein